jgi:hypothetical protein
MTVTDDEQDAPEIGVAPRAPGRRSPSAPAAPAARFEPGKVAETRHRNPTWLVAGVLLVLVSALGGVLLFTSNDDREDVLVAAAELHPGRPVERGDLRIGSVATGDGVSSMDPVDAAEVIGRFPIGRIPAGTMLTPGMFAREVPLGPDEMVLGAALDPGEAPLSGLEVGAPVELLSVTPADPARPEAEVAASALGRGTVWAVESIATGQLWVSMRVPRDVGVAASLASASDTLRVVLIGGAG